MIRKSSTLLILLACLCAPQAQAAVDQWSTHGPSNVGPMNTVAVDPVNPLIVYAGSGAGGALSKTTDGGLTWQPANTNLPTAGKTSLAIDPVNPDIVYVGVSGVWKSTNGGGSWTDVSNNNGMIVKSVRAVVVDPSNPNILYASTSGVPPNAIYRSPDGGGQWVQRSNGLPAGVGIVGALTIDPNNPATIYAGTQSGLFKTVDSGANWVPVNTGFTPDPDPIINVVVVDPHDSSIVYVGTGSFGVWKSTDAGGSWTRMSTGLASNLINGLVIDPRQTNVLYAGTGSSGVYRTTDGALTWTPFNDGLTANTIPALAISHSGTCLYAGTNVNGASGQVFDFARVLDCGEPPNYQGLWWNPLESGWGINFAHQGDIIFATWFTFGADNKPQWYTIRLDRQSGGVYSGPVSSFTGPPFSSDPFPPNANVKTPVGTATVTFAADGGSATFTYTVNGIEQTKQIVPQQFDPGVPLPACIWGGQPDLTLATNYQDLWWVTAGNESGWGINFTHQGNVIFATWFTYDVDGKAWWLFVVASRTAVPNVYSGPLKTATGPPFSAEPFDPNAVVRTTRGTATITIIDGGHATFDYTVDGVTQTKNLVRQVFVGPGTVCQ